MDSNTNCILSTFDMVIDIDIGLINMLKKEFNNPEYIKEYLLKLDNSLLIDILLNREEENPLSLLLVQEYKCHADLLYRQFIEKEYESILNNSQPTSIYNLLKLYSNTNLISINILCKNLLEEQIINQYNSKYKTKFKIVKKEELKLKDYDTIFIKSYKDCMNFYKDLYGKNIYVANYKFNYDKEDTNILLKEITSYIIDVNKISIIDIYNKDKLIKIRG